MKSPTYTEVREGLKASHEVALRIEMPQTALTLERALDYLAVGHVQMSKCRENLDNARYDQVADTAIGVLNVLGYGMEDRDTAGEPVSDAAQSLLMEAMFRVPGLVDVLREVAG